MILFNYIDIFIWLDGYYYWMQSWLWLYLNLFKSEMSLAFDEYGRPFIVIKEQDTKTRIKGVDAIKVHISSLSATS